MFRMRKARMGSRPRHVRPANISGNAVWNIMHSLGKANISYLHILHFFHRYLMGRLPYKASTCDAMYCRQRRRHLNYGGQIKKYYLSPSIVVST
jgi:hypothetical protein